VLVEFAITGATTRVSADAPPAGSIAPLEALVRRLLALRGAPAVMAVNFHNILKHKGKTWDRAVPHAAWAGIGAPDGGGWLAPFSMALPGALPDDESDAPGGGGGGEDDKHKHKRGRGAPGGGGERRSSQLPPLDTETLRLQASSRYAHFASHDASLRERIAQFQMYRSSQAIAAMGTWMQEATAAVYSYYGLPLVSIRDGCPLHGRKPPRMCVTRLGVCRYRLLPAFHSGALSPFDFVSWGDFGFHPPPAMQVSSAHLPLSLSLSLIHPHLLASLATGADVRGERGPRADAPRSHARPARRSRRRGCRRPRRRRSRRRRARARAAAAAARGSAASPSAGVLRMGPRLPPRLAPGTPRRTRPRTGPHRPSQR
jgi:hypothetical protein